MSTAELIAERIRQARETRGLTQNELGSKAGIAAASVSHFETGQRLPSLESLIKLADALEVSTDVLLGRVDGQKSVTRIDPLFLRASQSDAKTLNVLRRVTAALLEDAEKK